MGSARLLTNRQGGKHASKQVELLVGPKHTVNPLKKELPCSLKSCAAKMLLAYLVTQLNCCVTQPKVLQLNSCSWQRDTKVSWAWSPAKALVDSPLSQITQASLHQLSCVVAPDSKVALLAIVDAYSITCGPYWFTRLVKLCWQRNGAF